MEQKRISQTRGHPGKSLIFTEKKNGGKIELVARPAVEGPRSVVEGPRSVVG